MHRLLVLPIVVALAVGSAIAVPLSAAASDPGVTPDALLSQLTVAAPNSAGYDRDLFPTWIDANNDGCDTRAEVLKRSTNTDVTYSSGCTVATGSWNSWYDGATWTDASDVDIDSLVPLGEAWASGASAWSTDDRQRFANDLDDPFQLQAITDNVSESKGDRDPAQWMPPQSSVACQYVTYWVMVKWEWSLSIDAAEKTKLQQVLDAGACGTTLWATPTREMSPPVPPTTVTLPTVASSAICGHSLGSITYSGGSGVTVTLTDQHHSVTYANGAQLTLGYYFVTAKVDAGQVLHTKDLLPGWGDGDHSDGVFHDTTTTAEFGVNLEPMGGCGSMLDTLLTGQSLFEAGSLLSQNQLFELDMQIDGNLVEYNNSHQVIWNSGTAGHPGAHVDMQSDGNLVVYSTQDQPLWSSHTSGRSGAFATLQSDGNFVIYQGATPVYSGFAAQPPSQTAIDTTPLSQWVLPAGSQLTAGQQLTHGSYRAVMQGDGNFVVYSGTRPLWYTGTSTPNSTLAVQTDGNMVVYDPEGRPLWSAQSSGAGSKLRMQLDGNLVLYRGDYSPSWYSAHDTGIRIPPPPPPAPPAAQYTLTAGSQMNGGDQLVYGSYRATMQTDGNFVVYNGAAPVWASNTGGNSGGYLRVQGDGNIVIYAAAGYPVWATMTSGVTQLVMQQDGNLVAYRADGSPAWYRLHDTSTHIAPPSAG